MTANFEPAAAAATTAALSGSTTGITGSPTTWAVTLDGAVPSGGGTVSISASGATLSTSTLTFTFGGATSQNFTIDRATDGTTAVSITNSMGLSNVGTPRNYTSSAASSVASEGAFRTAQTYLFQPAESASRAEQITGGGAYSPDIYAPTYDYVDWQSGWAWANGGGDFIDSAKVAQGSTVWASVATPTGSAGVVYDHTMTVTTAVAEAQHLAGWLAFKLVGSSAARKVATPFYATTGKRPAIDVTYADSSTATLACRIMAQCDSGSYAPLSTAQDLTLPVFAEFEQPTKRVTAATLRFSVTEQQWSGSPTDIKLAGILLPPRGGRLDGSGLAQQSGALDSGLASVTGIMGQHRITDSTVIGDILVESALAKSSESNYDPAIWGGSTDTGKWPHTVAGKWLKGAASQSYTTPTVVSSSYTGEGFEPLATGIGAMRLHMPAQSVVAGQEVTSAGRLASDMQLMLDEADFGTTDHLFIRYYVRMGTPYAPEPADRLQILSGGSPRWTDMSGKFGIGPSHATSYGGVSGTSGGGRGWQMRHTWLDADLGVGGPSEGGVTQGFHLYDFQTNNPSGHQYGLEDVQLERWGGAGGQGGVMYAGHWYCVETELKLNTVTAPSSYSEDGELRAWIDGRLVYERIGMVFRTLPIYDPGFSSSAIRPARTLGVKELWLNWFHGGQSENTIDRTLFVTGLAWGTEYIGPMRDGTPSWRPSSGAVSVISAATTLSSIDPSTQAFDPGTTPWKTSNNYQFSTISGYCGGVWVQSMRKWVAMGGGHASYSIPAPYSFDASALTWSWLHDPLPTDGMDAIASSIAGTVTDARTAAAGYGDKFDPIEWEWLGDSSSWGALAQPGVIQPEVAHSYFGNVWVPGSSVGNTNGIILKLYAGSGRAAECIVPTRHYLDLDDMRWGHTVNYRSNPSAAAGGSIYFGGTIDRVFSCTNTSGGTFRNSLDVFTPSTLTWSTASTTNDIILWVYSGGFLAHIPSSLLIHCPPATSQSGSGAQTYVSATQHQFWAVDAAALKAGTSATWAQLTISNPGGTWPVRDVYSGGCGSLTWCYCPLNGCFYAVNGEHNSTQLWKLSPPSAAVTQAEHLSGTWVVSAETLSSGIPSGGTGSSTGGVAEPYNRLVWDDTARCLLWFDYWIGNKPVAIRSVDFA